MLRKLELRTPLSKIPLLGNILCYRYEINKIITFFLGGDKFMSEMHLWQPVFTYSACEPVNKKKNERIHKLKEIGDSIYIYQNF